MPTDKTKSLMARLKASKRLPSPPGVAMRVLHLCRRDDSNLAELADTIMKDPALSARLLKFCNSSITGLDHGVASIREAVLLLGLRTVKLLALRFSVIPADTGTSCDGFDPKAFWLESFVAAVIARKLSETCFSVNGEEAFTAALLAKIGRLTMAHGVPNEYSRVLRESPDADSCLEAERRAFGVDHVELGVQLLEEWQLPQLLVAAVRHQLAPEEASAPAQEMARVVHAAVHLAPLFVEGEACSPRTFETARAIVEQELKLDQALWQPIVDAVLVDYEEVAKIFGVPIEGRMCVRDVFAEGQAAPADVEAVASSEQGHGGASAGAQACDEEDTLADLADQSALRARLDEAMRQCETGRRFALVLFDVDRLQAINDAHGREAGDLVLRRLIKSVRNALRDYDVFARYRDDEFAVLLPVADTKEACVAAARVRKCAADLRIDVEGCRLQTTVSVGLAATTDFTAAPTADELLAEAGRQLSLSKSLGRNTWSYRGRAACQVPACVAGSA